MSKPIERTASAEIIQPQVPPLPEYMLLVWTLSSVGYKGFWTYSASGTRSHCEERIRESDRTYALITLSPPSPVRTAASDEEIVEALKKTGWSGLFDGSFCDVWRAAERHHGITKEATDAE